MASYSRVSENRFNKSTDIAVDSVITSLIPITLRVPLKFGDQTISNIVCFRVRLTVSDSSGRTAEGWGETPLSVQWAWPSEVAYQDRLDSLVEFCRKLQQAWPTYQASGHPLEIGYDFIRNVLPDLQGSHNARAHRGEELPYLAALIANSAFDIALHDAYGNLHQVDIYDTYNATYMNRNLAAFLEPAASQLSTVSFSDTYPQDFLVYPPPQKLAAWHLVGGLDPLTPSELNDNSPEDGYPVLLREWIKTDGLKCLKIKLRGKDFDWDYDRLVQVGTISLQTGVEALSADFNCCVQEKAYVNQVLDRLRDEEPAIFERLLYVEQPFEYDLEQRHLDVHDVARRKPLFLDESAHDWQHVRLGYELGWNGVALKTCKTQTAPY